MSRRNRNKPHKTPPSARNGNGNGQKPYLFTEPPPYVADFSKVQIVDDPNEPSPESDGDGSTGTAGGSRVNSMKAGLRSRILFPDLVLKMIYSLAMAYSKKLKPSTALAEWLVWQMARGSVQSDLADEQLIYNKKLSAERATSGWEEARREDADKAGRSLEKAPYRVARALGRTKFGALYLIEKLTAIGDIIATNGSLEHPQRELLLDVLGVDHVLRNGCKVPACHDGPGLAAVVATAKARLEASIERSLDGLDRAEQSAAELGIFKKHDQETRNLKGDMARADRRFKWAWNMFHLVEKGMAPATIIDPETHEPVDLGQRVEAVPEAAPPGPPPAAPPPTEPPPEAAPDESWTAGVPKGMPEAVKQTYLLIGDAFHRNRTPGQAEPPPSSDEPSGEPGPPLA